MKKRMQLQRGDISGPGQRRNIVNQDVVDVGAARMSRYREGRNPSGSEGRHVLVPKCLALHAVRVSLQRDGAVFQMRQYEAGDADIVVDHFSLRSPGYRKQNLVEPGEFDLPPLNVQLAFVSHPSFILSPARWIRYKLGDCLRYS